MSKYYFYHNDALIVPFHVIANNILEADEKAKEKGINVLSSIVNVGLTLNLYNSSLIVIKPCYPLIRNDEKEFIPDYSQKPEQIIKNNGLIKTITIDTNKALIDFVYKLLPDIDVIKYKVFNKEYDLNNIYKWK